MRETKYREVNDRLTAYLLITMWHMTWCRIWRLVCWPWDFQAFMQIHLEWRRIIFQTSVSKHFLRNSFQNLVFFHIFSSRKIWCRSQKIVILNVEINQNIRVWCCSYTVWVVGYFIFAVELLFINLESEMNDAANREMSAKLSTEHITASTT